MARREFLAEFLGALGAKRIDWLDESAEFISGIVVYDETDPEETQEFRWHVREEEVPPIDVLRLVTLLRAEKLLSIDKIVASRAELFSRFTTAYGRYLSEPQFGELVKSLQAIQVNMVDDGRETDRYYIHE